jgi:hypothetical protein
VSDLCFLRSSLVNSLTCLSCRNDKQPVSRLSHTRKRQTTPSLPLQTRKTSPKSSKLAGPFVHEDDDDDDDDDNEHDRNDQAAPIEDGDDDTTTYEMPAEVVPLQPISPNASPRKQSSHDQDHEVSKATHVETSTEAKANTKDATPSPADESPAPLPAPPPTRAQSDWTADLASIMERHQRRTVSSEHHTPAQRLKHRKLGRAASGSSLANRTNSGSTLVNQESLHGDLSFSTSSDSLSAVPENLPSTQIGYETLEAEAARIQMTKRMGTSYEDENQGTRLASLGTVRDSAAPASAPGARARNRARK